MTKEFYKLYQMKASEDTKDRIYNSFNEIMKKDATINENYYEMTWWGIFENEHENDLEDLFCAFNSPEMKKELLFFGRSMSVSDIVVNSRGEAFYCDRIGFVELHEDIFNPNKIENKLMEGLYIAPGKQPKAISFINTLANKQAICEGYIEYLGLPTNFDVNLICNEEGKINGMEPNRGIYDKNGHLCDIIYGPILILAEGENGNDKSLTDKQANDLYDQFFCPEEVDFEKGNIVMRKIK